MDPNGFKTFSLRDAIWSYFRENRSYSRVEQIPWIVLVVTYPEDTTGIVYLINVGWDALEWGCTSSREADNECVSNIEQGCARNSLHHSGSDKPWGIFTSSAQAELFCTTTSGGQRASLHWWSGSRFWFVISPAPPDAVIGHTPGHPRPGSSIQAYQLF